MPALIATLGADSNPFKRELREAERASAVSGNRIGHNLQEGARLPSSTALREILTIFREIGRGNFSRIPGSLSILLQQFDAFKYLLTPMVGILTAVAAAAGYASYYFYKLAKSTENANDIMNTFHDTFRAQAEAMEMAGRRAEEYANQLRRLNEAAEQTPQSIGEAQTRLAQLTAQLKSDQDKALAQQNSGRGAAWIIDARKKLQENIELADALKNAQDKNPTKLVSRTSPTGMGYVERVPTTAAEEASRQKTVEVNGKKTTASLDEATNAVKQWTRDIQAAEKAQRDADEAVNETNRKAEKAKGDVERLKKESERDQKKANEEALAAGEKEAFEKTQRRLLRGNVNSLQAVGAFALPGQVEMLDVAKKSEKHLAKLATLADRNSHQHHFRGEW